jgi:hypothetical protein
VPVSFRILLNEDEIGAPIVEPIVVTRRLLRESGLVERGTPLLRIRLGSAEYEFRVGFRCYIGLRVEVGQSLRPGALLASGGADGEELPDVPQMLTAHQVDSTPAQ